MSCGNNTRNTCYQKSCQRYYNNNAQTFTAGGNLTLTLAGSSVVDTGISIDTQPTSFVVEKGGLYHISADVVINPSAAGNVTLSAYLDGVQMPCTIKTVTLVDDGYATIHTETDYAFASCCCGVSHTISFVLASLGAAAGTVTNLCAGVIKEA